MTAKPNEVERLIKKYMSGKNEVTRKDLINYVRSQCNTSNATFNSKMRTLESRGEVLKVGRGEYILSEGTSKTRLLLNDIEKVLKNNDFSVSDLSDDEDAEIFYRIYLTIKDVYETELGIRKIKIEDLIHESVEGMGYPVEELKINFNSNTDATISIGVNVCEGKGNNLLEIKGDIEYTDKKLELKERIQEIIQQKIVEFEG